MDEIRAELTKYPVKTRLSLSGTLIVGRDIVHAKIKERLDAGGSMVMLAKGNRSQQVVDACNAHGGFCLGSIGGPAARLAKDAIRKVEVVEYEELGMEAVWRIEIEDFPAFIIIDDKGNDFFDEVSTSVHLR